MSEPSPKHPEFARVCEIRDSTSIERLAYNPKARVLRVWFRDTATVWEYDGVFPGDFAALISAYSVGAIFNDRIRNRFNARRIAELVDREVPPRTNHSPSRLF